MRMFAAVLIILAFTVNTAVASPTGQGGGSSSDDGESNLSTIIMIAVAAGFSALIIGDIMADDAEDSQDAISGISEEELTEDTGVDWQSLTPDTAGTGIPALATSVFTVPEGRDLAAYFTALLEQGNGLYYEIQGNPAALGSMAPDEAAATAFSFLNCDWFVAGNEDGLYLFTSDSSEPVWVFDRAPVDSAAIRNAAEDFRAFSER